MGLISFVKNVGASIFGGSEAKAAPAEELKKELKVKIRCPLRSLINWRPAKKRGPFRALAVNLFASYSLREVTRPSPRSS